MNYKKIIVLVLLFLFSLFSVNAYTPNSNLVAYWTFDNLTDSSGNGQTLTNNGAVSTSSNCQSGTCYDFDGSTSYMSFTPHSSFPKYDESRTICTYVYHDDIVGNQLYLSYGTSGAKTIYSTYKTSTNFFATVDDFTVYTDTTNVSISTGYQYCSVYNSANSTIRHYVNGVFSSTDNVAYAFLTTTATMNIGRQISGVNYMNGKIDEMFVFNSSLSDDEILSLYTNGIQFNRPTLTIENISLINNTYSNLDYLNINLNISNTSTDNLINTTLYLSNGTNIQIGTNTQNVSYTLNNVSEGNLSMYTYSYNNETNITSDIFYYTFDYTKPNISIIGAIVQDFEVNFSTVFNVTDLNLYTCFMDITYLENVTNASQYDKYINCTDTTVFGAAGLYNAVLTATDLAGNVETLNLNGTVHPFVYIYFKDIYGSNIANYSATIYHEDYKHETVTNTNNPINVSPVYNDSLHLGNYTFIFDKLGYQLQNFTITINETSGGETYNFTVGFSKINVNVYDRDTLTLLSQLVNFELLNTGGTPYGAIFNTSTGNASFINTTFITGDYILRATSQDYNAVEYYFSYSGQENATINLYMLEANKTDDAGNSVIVDVKIVIQDAAGFNVGDGYILKILQQYASEGGDTFIVDSGKSNGQGEVLLNLEYNSIFYSVLIEKDGETLQRIDTFKITKYGTNCALGECYYFSLSETVASGDNYANSDNTDFNLRYVNITNSSGYIQFTFNNLDGLVNKYCLDVYQKVYFDFNIIGTSCLNASSGVISTIINGTDDGSFKGVAYVTSASGVLGTIYVEDTNLNMAWGVYGLIGTIILFFVAIGIGGYAASKNVQDAPAITLALVVGIMWATDSLQMVKWGYVILFTVTLIVGVIVWLLYRSK